MRETREGEGLTSPSTTTSLCTRRRLMSCMSVPSESAAVQMTTPGKSGERWSSASAMVRSSDWYAPSRTSVYDAQNGDSAPVHAAEGGSRTHDDIYGLV